MHWPPQKFLCKSDWPYVWCLSFWNCAISFASCDSTSVSQYLKLRKARPCNCIVLVEGWIAPMKRKGKRINKMDIQTHSNNNYFHSNCIHRRKNRDNFNSIPHTSMPTTNFPVIDSSQGGKYCKLKVNSVGNSLSFLSFFRFSVWIKFCEWNKTRNNYLFI